MNFFIFSMTAGMVILSVTLIMTMYRFFTGPTLPDRVTAFDLFAANFIALTCIFSVLTDNKAFMDVAIVLSLVSFLGASSFAYYLRSRRKLKQEQEKQNKQ